MKLLTQLSSWVLWLWQYSVTALICDTVGVESVLKMAWQYSRQVV